MFRGVIRILCHLRNLRIFIKGHKNLLLKQHHNKNVVYKISCVDCEATYVGQTRLLKTRINTVNHIKRKSSQYSVIMEHMEHS